MGEKDDAYIITKAMVDAANKQTVKTEEVSDVESKDS